MRYLPALLGLALATVLHAESGEPAKRPNFVFILVDDMGYGDVGAHGNEVIQTPNIDQLHGESVRFTNFCVSPTCAPTRAALMSGKHEFKVGVTHTILGREHMALEAVTIANVMQEAGYATGLFGKWHLGMKPGYRPHRRGFDVGLTDAQDSQEHHYDPVLQRNGVEEKHQGYRTDIFFNEAMKWISEKKDESFFCYIPTYSPHSPLIVPEKYSALYPNHEKEVKQFLGMMTNVDENIGRLRKYIETLGLKENTVIILINDNGGTWGVDVHNAGMRGRKASTLYGGIRALSFWAWPGQWKAAEHDHMTGHVDVFPTIAECADIELKPELKKSLDGVSMMSLIDPSRAKSKTDAEILKANDRMMVAHRARWSDIEGKSNAEVMQDSKYSYCSVRWRHYLAVRIKHCGNETCATCNKISNRWQDVPGKKRPYTSNAFHYLPPEDKWMLHDLKADLSQESDIAAQQPELLKRMTDHYEAWWESVEKSTP